MKKPTHKKNTLLKNAEANAKGNFLKRVFFSPTQEKFLPTLLFLIKLFSQRTGFVRNLTDIASNVNRFEQSVCELQTVVLRTDSRAADNIKLKEILKRRALFGNQTVVLLINSVALTNPARAGLLIPF